MKFCAIVLPLFFVVACTQQKNVSSISANKNQSSIINGQTVTADDVISKQVVAVTDDQWENCTGTLIAENLVLTAAHCFTQGKAMYVAFGLEVSQDNLSQVDRREVTNYRLIPGRDKVTPDQETDLKDLMILEFEGGLPQGYQAAQFLPPTTEIVKGMMVTVAGYGVTNGHTQKGDGTLRKTQVPVAFATFSEHDVATSESKTGTCNIDSGGPAFLAVNGELYFWGVTSYGDENCHKFGVYTKINSYRDWVDSVIADLAVKH